MKKWIYYSLIALFSLVLLVSLGHIGWYLISSRIQASAYQTLAQNMESHAVTPRPVINQDDTVTEVSPPQFVDVKDPETGESVSLLSRFQELYVQNNDMVGWITVPGTNINYPVMQTPDSPDYYLKRNFEKKSSKHGCIYVREQCDVSTPSDNLTIYGHRMRDGSMFAALDSYTDKTFWQDNPYIYFDTLSELHTYKIMAVFRTTATAGQGFAYHTFVDAETDADFQSFVDTCKSLSLYDTGVTAAPGDKFITLSTCEYSQTNGRLVVVAKRIG